MALYRVQNKPLHRGSDNLRFHERGTNRGRGGELQGWIKGENMLQSQHSFQNKDDFNAVSLFPQPSSPASKLHLQGFWTPFPYKVSARFCSLSPLLHSPILWMERDGKVKIINLGVSYCCLVPLFSFKHFFLHLSQTARYSSTHLHTLIASFVCVSLFIFKETASHFFLAIFALGPLN